jgi:ribosomal protein S18 acetylase RimI-like enzyme
VDSDAGTPSYSLRPAVPEDSDFIYAVRVAGLRDYVAQIWGWDDQFQTLRFRDTFDPARYQVILIAGRAVGALSIDWRGDEVFLADIEILPEWRNRGLGSAIIESILTEANRRCLPVSLRVLRVNPARRLYERLGFRVVGETETHYLMSTNRRGPDG